MNKLTQIAEHMSRSLATALGAGLHDHPTLKGDASEDVWRIWFERHLPRRYAIDRACLIDADGRQSEQIDVVIYDANYTPSLYSSEYGARFLAAESVYAVFEVKQDFTAPHMKDAHEKAASVRKLRRTTAPIFHAGGEISKPKKPIHIIAGILALKSTWTPPLGDTLIENLSSADDDSRLDCGIAIQHGMFHRRPASGTPRWEVHDGDNHALRFLMTLLHHLSEQGTVTAIEFDQYVAGIDK